jgi:TnpA family transposase
MLFLGLSRIDVNNIDNLFTDVNDWEMFEKNWMDMMQVFLSIREGKISSAVLLRRLDNYSKKNKLYQTFRDLGRVVRTILFSIIYQIMKRGKELPQVLTKLNLTISFLSSSFLDC